MNEQKIAPVLNDDEIAEIVRKWHESIGSMNALLRATEQAVLARVGAVREQALACLMPEVLASLKYHGQDVSLIADIEKALKGTPAAAVADEEPIAWHSKVYGTCWIKQLRDMKPGTKWYMAGRSEHVAQVSEIGAAIIWNMSTSDIPHGTKFYAAPQAPQLSGNPGQVADAQPVALKTDDQMGNVLATIQHYGSQKWAEGRGQAPADLLNVRQAWDEVYAAVQALAAQPSAPAQPSGNAGEVTPVERQALVGLIDVASSAYHAADDSEEDDDPNRIHVDKASMNALGDALEKLDQLPDDCPGYTMGPSGKAEWALRRLFGKASISGNAGELAAALHLAEAALADIGDADREPGDDLAWCERRAAEALPAVRAAIAASKGANHG